MTHDDLSRPLPDSSKETGSASARDPQTAGAQSALPREPRGRRPTSKDRVVHRTRSETWLFGLLGFAIVLIALLIFILQNSQSVAIHYFTARGHLPLAVAMLFAAIAGVLLVAIPTGVRALQLRRSARRRAREAAAGTTGSVLDDHRDDGPGRLGA